MLTLIQIFTSIRKTDDGVTDLFIELSEIDVFVTASTISDESEVKIQQFNELTLLTFVDHRSGIGRFTSN